MIRRPRKTPQLVTVNRVFLIIGIVGLLAMIGYIYWEQNHLKVPPSVQRTVP